MYPLFWVRFGVQIDHSWDDRFGRFFSVFIQGVDGFEQQYCGEDNRLGDQWFHREFHERQLTIATTSCFASEERSKEYFDYLHKLVYAKLIHTKVR